jgi:hypothetical protein
MDLVEVYILDCPVGSIEHQYLLLSSKYILSIERFLCTKYESPKYKFCNYVLKLKRNIGRHFLSIMLLI